MRQGMSLAEARGLTVTEAEGCLELLTAAAAGNSETTTYVNGRRGRRRDKR